MPARPLVIAAALAVASVVRAGDVTAAPEAQAPAPSAAPAIAPLPASKASGIAPGEQIEWRVDFLGVKSGRARMQLGRAEGAIWPVIAQAKTEGVAKVVDIREHYVAYWNAADMLSHGTDLEAMEIGDHLREKSRFDREQGKVTVTWWRKGREKQKVVDVPRDVHDLAGAMMWLRMQALEPGSTYEIPVFTGSKTFTMRAAVVGREKVSTAIGTFDTVRVDLLLGFDKKFKTDRPSHVWFSDDERHVPVKMAAEFAVGSVVATATHYTPGGQVAAR
jgi:hypothetical protein